MAGWQQEKTGRQGLLRNWQVERNGMERNKTISGQTRQGGKGVNALRVWGACVLIPAVNGWAME